MVSPKRCFPISSGRTLPEKLGTCQTRARWHVSHIEPEFMQKLKDPEKEGQGVLQSNIMQAQKVACTLTAPCQKILECHQWSAKVSLNQAVDGIAFFPQHALNLQIWHLCPSHKCLQHFKDLCTMSRCTCRCTIMFCLSQSASIQAWLP